MISHRCNHVRVLYLFLAAVLCRPAPAQDSARLSDHNFHTWYMYFGDHPLGESRWGIHFDGQFRRQGIGQRWQQLLLRPGVNYDLTAKLQLSGGYAFIRSHPYGDYPAKFVTPEHRIWEQFIVKNKVGEVGLTHRFRLEQRFIGVKVPDGDGRGRIDRYSLRHRFRYFIKGVVPIRRDAAGNNRYYLGLYNEIMFNFGREATTTFDQNRAYAALGIRLPRVGNLELGYLQQTVQQGNGRVIEFNHTLQIGIFSTLKIGR